MSNDPKTTLLEAVKSASEKWKSAFNSGNAIESMSILSEQKNYCNCKLD